MCFKTKLLQQHFVSTAIKWNKHYRIVKMLELADLDTSKFTQNLYDYESPRFLRNVIACSWHGVKIHIMNVDSSPPKQN